jgi:DnaJ homolog subfamily C member 3
MAMRWTPFPTTMIVTFSTSDDATRLSKYDANLPSVNTSPAHLPPVPLVPARLDQLRKAREAMDECNHAIGINDNLFEAHLFKAEAHLLLDEIDAAYREFSRAQQVNQHDHRAAEGLQRVARLQQMAKRKDYYKILGIDKETPRAMIRKAYRKKALEWHPDKHPEDKKAEAEARFQEINEAYEILNDDGMSLLL